MRWLISGLLTTRKSALSVQGLGSPERCEGSPEKQRPPPKGPVWKGRVFGCELGQQVDSVQHAGD